MPCEVIRSRLEDDGAIISIRGDTAVQQDGSQADYQWPGCGRPARRRSRPGLAGLGWQRDCGNDLIRLTDYVSGLGKGGV
jgi:hypothetical protein